MPLYTVTLCALVSKSTSEGTATPPILSAFASHPPQFFHDIDSSDPALTNDTEVPWLLFQDTPSIPDTPQATTIVLSQPLRKKKQKEKIETREAAHQRKIDAKYDAFPATQQIEVADGYITFCHTFKYLGSRISYNLRDDADIEA